MTQPRNLLELIELVKPTAALFTTYTFEVKYFDAVLWPVLQKVGCKTISVLVDAEMAARCASEFTSRAAGRRYRLSTVIAPGGGVFHPKLAYLVGVEDHALSVGSGNLTAAGLAVQLETFDAVSARQTPTVFAAFRCWMLQLADKSELKSKHASSELRRFAEYAAHALQLNQSAPVGKDAYIAVEGRLPPVLVHTLTDTARDTLQDIFLSQSRSAKCVTVLAPFHAPDGGPVIRLAESLQAKTLKVGLDARASSPTAPFDRRKFVKPDWCEFVVPRLGNDDAGENGDDHDEEWDGDEETEGEGKGEVGPKGRLHAKVFVIEGKSGALVMTGSVNATVQSFESTKNVEVSLARWMPNSPFAWTDIRPEYYKATQDPKDFGPRAPFYVEASLDGAVLNGLISPPGAVTGEVRLLVTNGASSIFEADVRLNEASAFSVRLTADFETKAGLQVAATARNATASCFVNVIEDLEEAETGPRTLDPAAAEALGRVRSGLCSIADLTRLLQHFIPLRVGGVWNLATPPKPSVAAGEVPGGRTSGHQPPPPPSRALAELTRAVRLAADALLTSAEGSVETTSTPTPGRRPGTPRALKPTQAKTLKQRVRGRPGDDRSEQSQARVALFWRIEELHETKPAYDESIALAAFAAQWAFELGRIQSDGPELCSAWLERFSWHEYPDGHQQTLAALSVALACVAAARMEAQGRLAPLSMLKEAAEFFAGEELSSQRWSTLCAEGIELDTFSRIQDAERAAAMSAVGRLFGASSLDQKVLALLRKSRSPTCRTLAREPESEGFLSIAQELQRRTPRKAELLLGIVEKGTTGCPHCSKALEDDHRSALRKLHLASHVRGCGKLLFQSLNNARLRRGIEELPGA